MKKTLLIPLGLGVLLAAVAFVTWSEEPPVRVHAADDGLALTPPMGWYPWNIFGEEPQNEALIKEIVDALVTSGMRDAGYQYVGPDEGICFSRGTDGKLTTNLKRYPSGLRGLGDYIHKKGLKYALYTDAGTRTCSKAMPGTKGHELEDMRAFAEWRADYIKIDWCNTEGMDIVKSYTALHDAQHAAGRPLIHSLCSWGDGEPWKWAAPVGHMWRTTSDICSPGKVDWANAMKIVAENQKLYPWAGPGHWNDPDMMIVGMPEMTEVRNRSFFSLWCMMAAPLMAGNDLRVMDKPVIDVLTNPEAIAVDQDPLGIQGRIVRTVGMVSIWAGKELFDGSRAVLLFSQDPAPAAVRIAWSDLGVPESTGLFVRDLWKHETTGVHTKALTITVAPNDVAFLRFSPVNAFPRPPIVVADTYLVSLRAEGTEPRTLTAAVNVSNNGSADLPAWRVHSGLPPWLAVGVLRNGRSQTFVNTVSTAGLKPGLYHAMVRADNTEPVSGKPMSALYYDVDLEVTGGPKTAAK
jgi:alpha-galactosidase